MWYPLLNRIVIVFKCNIMFGWWLLSRSVNATYSNRLANFLPLHLVILLLLVWLTQNYYSFRTPETTRIDREISFRLNILYLNETWKCIVKEPVVNVSLHWIFVVVEIKVSADHQHFDKDSWQDVVYVGSSLAVGLPNTLRQWYSKYLLSCWIWVALHFKLVIYWT